MPVLYMDGSGRLTVATSTIGGKEVAIITGAIKRSQSVGADLSTSISVSCTLIDVWGGIERDLYIHCTCSLLGLVV